MFYSVLQFLFFGRSVIVQLNQRGLAAALAIRKPAIAGDGPERHSYDVPNLPYRKTGAAQPDYCGTAQAMQRYIFKLGNIFNRFGEVLPKQPAVVILAVWLSQEQPGCLSP